ncbi:hypothetical protein ACFL2J_01150 [Candidatus Omnitrophota bacterium]
MDKDRTKVIITAVLIAVLVFAWANAFKVLAKRSKSKKPKQAPSVLISTTSAISTVTSISKREWSEDKNLEWKRCPFCGVSYSHEASAEDLEISGIIWDEVNPQTIINGQIFSEGERIGDFLIQTIEKQKVILSDGAKTIELQI